MTHLSRIERGEVEMTDTERAAFDAATAGVMRAMEQRRDGRPTR